MSFALKGANGHRAGVEGPEVVRVLCQAARRTCANAPRPGLVGKE